jgi:hypothetical protein
MKKIEERRMTPMNQRENSQVKEDSHHGIGSNHARGQSMPREQSHDTATSPSEFSNQFRSADISLQQTEQQQSNIVNRAAQLSITD